jgi:hypothetical protein
MDAREPAQQLFERCALLCGIETLDLLASEEDVIRPFVQALDVVERNEVFDDQVAVLVEKDVARCQ